MGWGSNWGFSDASKARASAADFFLNTGNIGTPFGGTWCKGSSDCASGYACSGGRCVPITQEKGSDGTLSGCGAPGGGGGCDSYVTQGMTASDAAARGYTWSNGVGTKGFNWEPIYSKDGCTITGCAMGPCGGGENPVDCPGPRSCRYDAFGTVNCFCGEPPVNDCSEFCTAYKKSNGEDADGCNGLACDECSYCDQIFISATGECKPIENGSPCHCDPDSLPECNKCNEDGTIESDEENCFKCVEIFNEPCNCNPNIQLSKTCCYPLSEWKQGLSPVARCKQEIQKECESLCDNSPPYIDPCQGDCESFTVCDTTCPTPPPPPDGSSQTITGQIEVPGQCCVTYTNCDKTNVPESCSECDCNCHDDCPDCQLCGADGKCYPDPACEGDKVSVWAFNVPTYEVYTISAWPDCGPDSWTTAGGYVAEHASSPGPLPHSIQQTGPCLYQRETITPPDNNCPYDTIVESVGAYFTILDANGNQIGVFQAPSPSGWTGGAHPSSGEIGCLSPTFVRIEEP